MKDGDPLEMGNTGGELITGRKCAVSRAKAGSSTAQSFPKLKRQSREFGEPKEASIPRAEHWGGESCTERELRSSAVQSSTEYRLVHVQSLEEKHT
jgi:hypothetical protein